MSGAAATDHRRWASIDAIRAVAALSVLTAHAYLYGGVPTDSTTGRVADALADGVWLFFVVSGFLIAGPFLQCLLRGGPVPPVARYARRRAARILPGYWIAFAAILVLVTGDEISSWWQVPVHLVLAHMLVPDEGQKLFFVAWTLSLEAIFYVLVPIGAVLVARIRRGAAVEPGPLAAGIAGLWMLSVLLGLLLAAVDPFLDPDASGLTKVLLAAVDMGAFAPGLLVFLAESDAVADRQGLWARYRDLARRPGLTLPLATVLWIIAERIPTATDPVAFVLFLPIISTAAALVVATVLSGALERRLGRVFALLAPVGLISYGVYLWHWVILQVLQRHDLIIIDDNHPPAWLVHIVLLAALALPVALLSWVFVERPLIRRTAHWERRGPA